jgi:hypothetical protein
MSAVRRVLAGLLIASLAAATPALAAKYARLAPGVHGTPGSPAGQEYVIPLGQARNTAGGNGAKPFGQGITPAQGGASATASGATASGSATQSGGRRAGSAKPRGTAKRRHGRRAPIASTARFAKPLRASAGGGSGLAWMGGAALLVLAIGGFGGYLLRRSWR